MWMSGYNVEKLILMVTKDENVDPEKRDKTTAYITAQMTRHIGFQRALGRTVRKSNPTLTFCIQENNICIKEDI